MHIRLSRSNTQRTVKTISPDSSNGEPRGTQSTLFYSIKEVYMLIQLLIVIAFWLPFSGIYKQLDRLILIFKQQPHFQPSEFEAMNIKLDFGNSPEPRTLSRKEKFTLKLSQITNLKTALKE